MAKRIIYESLEELRADGYPYATYEDYWDHNASVYSGGQLPDPLESPEYLARARYYEVTERDRGGREYRRYRDDQDRYASSSKRYREDEDRYSYSNSRKSSDRY